MARQDIAGLLTGISSDRPDPMAMGSNSAQQRLAFGAQRGQNLQRGVRGMMGGNTMTNAEQLQMAMASLDLSNPADLRKLAGIQQATGDLAGAAKTAAGIRELELEGKTRTAVSDALIKLGDTENAQRVLDKTLTPVAGQQLVFRLQADSRSKTSKEEEAAAKLPVTMKTQERILKAAGVPEDHPVWAETRAGDYGDTTTSEMIAIAKTLAPDMDVAREGSTKYILPSGQAVWAAETTVGAKPKELMYPSGVDANGKQQYTSLPTDAKKYKDRENTGVTITRQDSDDALYELVNAGKRAGFDNSAYNNLTPYEQDQLINNVAARTNEIVKEKGLNEPEARKEAVQELYIKRIEETPKEERSIISQDMYRFKKAPEDKLDDADVDGTEKIKEGTIIVHPTTKERKQLIDGEWIILS